MKPLILTDPNSTRRTAIVVGAKAGEHERAAAFELRHYIARLSGAGYGTVGTKLAVISDEEEHAGPLISLGKTRHSEAMGIDAAGLGPEGFRIARADHALCLVGADDIGTRFAAYHFLEEILGVRWFWPGDTGEDIPELRSIAIGDLDYRSEPSFKMRHLGEHHQSLWGLRNRLGGSSDIHGVHSFGTMIPPDRHGSLHPEYFALVNGERQYKNFNGKHGCQLCTSNPDVVNLCIDYVRKFFDTHPAGVAFNISPNDGAGFCECPECRKLDQGRLCEFNGRMLPSASGQIFAFANKVGKAVARSHPDRRVVILAYHQYLDPPPAADFTLHANVILQLCLHCDSDPVAPRLQQTEDILKKWAGKTASKAVYEYLVWRGNADLPRSLVSVLPAALKRYHQGGCTLFHTQAFDDFGPSGLNYYLAAKLLWNINNDVPALMDDYFSRCFGSAGPAMRHYSELLDERWRHAVQTIGSDFYPGSPAYYLEMFPPAVLDAMDRLLSEAAGRAGCHKSKARVERFLLLQEHTRRSMAAIRSLKELEAAGICHTNPPWPTQIHMTPPPKPASKFEAEWEPRAVASGRKAGNRNDEPSAAALALVEQAIDAWDSRKRHIEDIRDAGVIDYWHLRHDVDRDYRNDPTATLVELKTMMSGQGAKGRGGEQ